MTDLFNEKINLLEKIAKKSKSQVEFFLKFNEGQALSLKKEGVDSSKTGQEIGLSVRVIDKEKVGFAYTSKLDEKTINDTIARALVIAKIKQTPFQKEFMTSKPKTTISVDKKLNDLDTENVKPMTHPIETLKNVFREDKVGKSLTNEEALKNAQYKQDGFFKAPRILKD